MSNTTKTTKELAVKLDEIGQRRQELALAAAENRFALAFETAGMVNQMRDLITEEAMAQILPLQGSDLGFRTDKDQDGGYPAKVVKEVVIEATLKGFALTNNEFNIIRGRFYAAKNGLKRRVREFPGLTDLDIKISVPFKKDGDTLVKTAATWNLSGKPQSIERTFAIIVNGGMGADAIQGKAERKLFKAILEKLTGSEISDGEVDDVVPAPAKPVNQSPDFGEPATEKPAEPSMRKREPEVIDAEVRPVDDEPKAEPAVAKPGVILGEPPAEGASKKERCEFIMETLDANNVDKLELLDRLKEAKFIDKDITRLSQFTDEEIDATIRDLGGLIGEILTVKGGK